MRRGALLVAVAMLWALPGGIRSQVRETVEIPLRVEGGRMMVTVEGPDGGSYDFVLALGTPLLSRSGAARIGDALESLTLGGIPVVMEMVSTVTDAMLEVGGYTPDGVLGSGTLNQYDALIDVPGGRLVLKPVGRYVRWEGMELTSPVRLEIFHEILIRTQVRIGEEIYGGLLDLSNPAIQVNPPVQSATGISGETLPSFRMGYTGWSGLPFEVTESPVFDRWTAPDKGFVIIGAAVALRCPISISWAHEEMRTCVSPAPSRN